MALTEAMTRYAEIMAHDMDHRVRSDLLYFNTLDQDERARLLKHRSAECRYFGKLNELAAVIGPDCEYTDDLNCKLRLEGYTEYERGKIAQKLGHGYAGEVYLPGSKVTATPPQIFFDRYVSPPDHKPGNTAVLAALAWGRAKIEAIAATHYNRAQSDLDGVLAAIPLRAPPSRSFDGFEWSAPSYACADAIIRRQYSVEIGSSDRDPIIVGPSIDPAFHGPVAKSEVSKIAATIDSDETISSLVEALIVQKGEEWDIKTASQVRHVGRILIGVVGSDRVDRLTSGNVEAYRDVLPMIPKTFGKSSKDRDVSLKDIIIRARNLPKEQVGLSSITVKRHLSHLRAILTFARIMDFRSKAKK